MRVNRRTDRWRAYIHIGWEGACTACGSRRTALAYEICHHYDDPYTDLRNEANRDLNCRSCKSCRIKWLGRMDNKRAMARSGIMERKVTKKEIED